jgi:hypothetical protein
MPQETLSSELEYATVSQNVADEPTPIVTWDVPDGSEITLREGNAVVFDVDAAGGGSVSRSTRIGLAYREPNDPLGAWTVVSDLPVAPFNTLSLKDQQSGDNAQRRRLTFDPERVDGGSLTIEDADEIALVVVGPDQVDDASVFFNYPVTIKNV